MTKRILVIEDQEDLRGILRDLLTGSGYEMLEAPDGQAGVDKAKVEKPDLLEPFPSRPKHMQRRTYARLRALDARLMGSSLVGLAMFTDRLRARIGPAANLKNNQNKSNRPSRVAARPRMGRRPKA